MSVHSQLNNPAVVSNSPSKQKFSFPKAQRFPKINQSVCEKTFYQIPEKRQKRTTTFGVGEKLTLSSKNNSPPPNRYTIETQFQQSYLVKKKGFSFGFGRDIVSGGPLDDSKHKKYVPGPGQYPTSTTLQSRAPSLKPRLPDLSMNHLKNVPGPGYYNPPAFINEKGKYVLSKLANSPSRSFSPLGIEKKIAVTQSSKLPGPGAYDLINMGINDKGKYFYSRFHNSNVRTFEKCPRPDVSIKSMKGNPGPGSYKNYSDFG